jgi:uncharacterized membrane protein
VRLTYVVHILAGALGIVSGFIALYATKGARLHRRLGMVFVYVMVPAAVFGMVIAVVRGVAPAVNLPAGALTAYLVLTALTTIRPATPAARWMDPGLLLVALAVTVASSWFAVEAFANGGTRNGIPAFPFVMFGVVGLLATVGDFRMIRSGGIRGARRVARHLWRMSFALFIAALSFFIGQAQVIPEPIRIRPLLALPVLLVLVTMFYWLWRVRIKQSLRGLVGVSAVPAA